MRLINTTLSAFDFSEKACLTLLLIACSAVATSAGEFSVSNEFSSGTPAIAAEVNQNFNDVETAVNDNNARPGIVESSVGDAENRISGIETAITEITDRLNALETSTAEDNGISVQTYFATDLTFLLPSGPLFIPTSRPTPIWRWPYLLMVPAPPLALLSDSQLLPFAAHCDERLVSILVVFHTSA